MHALIGTLTFSKSILPSGILALYSLDEWGTGYLVMSHNLNPLPHDFPAKFDIMTSSLRELQKLACRLKSRGVQTRFVHFAKPAELFVSKDDMENFFQPLRNFWKCRCESGPIHNISPSLPASCRRCGAMEKDSPRASVDEVFSELRMNFDQMRPVHIWETDPSGSGRKFFFGGFPSRHIAEYAISRYMETGSSRLDSFTSGFWSADRTPGALRGAERWIIEEQTDGQIALQS
jgi:hypothetical protein